MKARPGRALRCAPFTRAALAWAALLLGGASVRGDEKGVDEWHLMYIAGAPAGFLHITHAPRDGGGFTVSANQRLVVRRGLVALDTEATTTVEEDAQGKVLGFRMMQRLSSDPIETTGVARDGVLEVTDRVGGKDPRTSKIPLDPRALGLHASEEVLKQKIKAPGDSAEVVVFVPEARRFGKMSAVFEKLEKVDLRGKKVELRRYKATFDVIPGVVTLQWFDDKLDLQKSSVSILGMTMTTERSSFEEVSKQDFTSPPEIFFASSVPVAKRVRPEWQEVVYKVSARSGDLPASGPRLFPAACTEVLERTSPGVLRVRVRSAAPSKSAPPRSVPRPVQATPQLEEFLRPNTYIQSDDPAIAAAAAKQVGDEKDGYKAAVLLERWVFENVRVKSMNMGFATASEVMKSREGDCTEHGVLLAALLRAAGLPSRVVAGLVYHEGAFVGHMWTEVHLGEWVPLDATRPAGGAGPDHLGLSVSSLASASVADIFLDVIPMIGNVSIEVDSFKG